MASLGMTASSLTASSLSSRRFAGVRVSAKPAAAPRMVAFAVPITALFTKSKVAASKAIPKNGKKILTAGKDIKGQQFNVDLGLGRKVPVQLGFTKSNELFVGRMAMLGFATAIIGEIITGKGALAQIGFETGLPIQDVDGLILIVIAFNLIAALLPAKGKFVAEGEELIDRPKGALQDAKISLADPKKFFGISGFGFSKANELFVGRTAQLGFAAALIGEAITGVGPLKQLGFETGIPLSEAEPLLLFSIAFTLLAAINEGSGKFVEEE